MFIIHADQDSTTVLLPKKGVGVPSLWDVFLSVCPSLSLSVTKERG